MSRTRIVPNMLNGRDVRGETRHGWQVLAEAATVYRKVNSSAHGEVFVPCRMFRCQCTSCGKRALQSGTNLFYRPKQSRNIGCASCTKRIAGEATRAETARRRKHTPCKWCGSSCANSNMARVCVACDRRRHRNGSCSTCGFPLYRTKPCTHEVRS